MNNHRPRKRFGQHFLHDPQVVARIIGAFRPRRDDFVVEIGSGQGVLTRELAEKTASLHALELDRDLAAHLRTTFAGTTRVHIHEADALAFDYCGLVGDGQRLRLIGNLPYNISTPLLFHLLDRAVCIQDMLFMLQKEVVQRLCANPGSKNYGRLSIMAQWRCQTEQLFTVGPGAFFPPPKVDSAVVRITPLQAPLIQVANPQLFADLVQAAFNQRRKTLRNALKLFLEQEQISGLGIDPRRRPETLSLEEFATLSNTVVARNK